MSAQSFKIMPFTAGLLTATILGCGHDRSLPGVADAQAVRDSYSPPTCSDGIQNQAEAGVDCGGPCTPCSGGCPAPGGNIIQNGSLEDLNSTFVNTSGNYMSLPAGNMDITNWMVTPATVGSIVWAQSPTIDGFTAADGRFFVDLTGLSADSANGALQETVTISAGVLYNFSVDVASFNNGQVSVSIGSHTLVLTSGASFVVGSMSWTRLTSTFVGDPLEPTPLLRVMNISPGSTFVFVDNIIQSCDG